MNRPSSKVFRCAAAGWLLLPALAVAAQDTSVGDAQRGAAAAVTCRACHGPLGEGIPANGFPRLAGQAASYLAKQLNDYASGLREHAVMSPMAKTLNEQQRADLAAYFASLSPPRAPSTDKPDPRQRARGRLLAATGDESKQLQACANCHGPEGRGEAFAAPYLAGQSAIYLTNAIAAWKAGTRKNDGGMLMTTVTTRLDDQDIAAVSAYFYSLEPPKP
jgi:cytochrome c553